MSGDIEPQQNRPPQSRAFAPGSVGNIGVGFATVILKDVEVQIGRRTSLPVTLSTGKVETLTVTAEAPLIDPKATSIGENVKIDTFVENVPLGRNFSDTFAVVPGVVGGGGTGAGNYSISGSSGLENRYIIDGVDITNTGYGGIGSYNIVFGSLGTGVTYDFLEEVQVKTGGIDVEYGQATGGVINTVVKSGTNELSGAVSLYAGAPVNEFKQSALVYAVRANRTAIVALLLKAGADPKPLTPRRLPLS